MKNPLKKKKYKVRSGKRVLGEIVKVGDGGFTWKTNRKNGDRGISGDLSRAADNIIKDFSGTTAEGYKRQFIVSVDED